MTSKALSSPLENKGGDIHVPHVHTTNNNTTSSSSSSQSSTIVDCSKESINAVDVVSAVINEQIDSANGSKNLPMEKMSGENNESSNGSSNLKANDLMEHFCDSKEIKGQDALVSNSCLGEVGMQQGYAPVPKKNEKEIIFLSDDSGHGSDVDISPNDKKEEGDTEGREQDDISFERAKDRHNGTLLENNRCQNSKDSTYAPRIHGKDNKLTHNGGAIPDHNNFT